MSIQGFVEPSPKPQNTPWGLIIGVIVVILIIVVVSLGYARKGFFPSDCDKDPSPCLNGATNCEDEWWDGYKCTCTEDWSGKNCQTATPKGISKRPCEKDNPCYHTDICNDIDENADGIFEKYTCGVEGKCPEIKGLPGQHWDGDNCNDFPSSVTVDDYSEKCFTDVGKTDSQKEYLKQCKDSNKCSNPDPHEMMMNCENNCNESVTHRWCTDNNICVDRYKINDIKKCHSLWRDRMENHERHSVNREKCHNDHSTKWDHYDHICSCNHSLNRTCGNLSGPGNKDKCEDHAECCQWNSASETCEKNDNFKHGQFLYGNDNYNRDHHHKRHFDDCVYEHMDDHDMSRKDAKEICEEREYNRDIYLI